MKHLLTSYVRSAIVAGVVSTLLLGCGGAGSQDAQAPTKIAQLDRASWASGTEAKRMINEIHDAGPATNDSWVASYGEEDRLVIYATAFATVEEASSNFSRMQAELAQGTDRYSAATPGTIAQHAGFRMQDNEENKQVFNYQKGRWVMGIRGIAPDMEAAVFSIEWVAPK